MAKDYFEDITPPNGPPIKPSRPDIPPRPARPTFQDDDDSIPAAPPMGGGEPERSVRNIQITPTRPRRGPDTREYPSAPSHPPRIGRMWIWGGVGLAVVVLAVLLLVALRPTTITVTPRSHTILFDETAQFTAYPADSALPGTLSYTVEMNSFEDSQVVSAQGVENVNERASGTITVYNNYSTSPVKLIKNTRFETPDGLIFRTPAEISIPGKKEQTPGQISVTVIADEPGERYNVAAVSRFTVPGLKSTPDMFAGVYAASAEAMSGGFSGERPIAAPGAVESAKAEIRDRLEKKAREAIQAFSNDDMIAFFDLSHLSYESLPPTAEAGDGVRLHERVRVEVPVFPADLFAQVIAKSVSADAELGSVHLVKGASLSTQTETIFNASLPSLLFSLQGTGQLIWNVDTEELATALAGRDESAFETIVGGFPSIEEAHARIQPFWKSSFPDKASSMKIKVEEPDFTG